MEPVETTSDQSAGPRRRVPRIVAVRALVVRGGGADYHDQPAGHWIDSQISTPMSKYPEYRAERRSFGINVLGTTVVEIEADDGTVGFAPTTGGEITAWIVERHLARFIEGALITDIERIWDQMYLASAFYGRRGVVLNTISCVDLALWDLLAKWRDEPVYQLLGGPVRDELQFYATGPRPDLAKKMGFIGGKMTLTHGPAEGDKGMAANLAELAAMRDAVGPDYRLKWDAWMSLDVPYAIELARRAADLGLYWLEEPFLPDDYWAYRDTRKALPPGMLLTGGEHEGTRWGFRMMLEMECVDILQPDVGWCGGITELIKISALADAAGKQVIPHGSSVYSYHFVITRHNSPYAEFLMMHPTAEEVVPMFSPLLLDEPVPVDGRLRVPDRPGFGVRLNPDLPTTRPYSH